MKIKLFTLLLLSISFLSGTFSQINWQSTNGPEGGRFSNIYDDGLYAYVTNVNGFYRTNTGLGWEQISDKRIMPLGTSPTKLAGQKALENIYGVLSDYSFVVSYDHGMTWTEGTMPPSSQQNFSDIAVCSHGIYVPVGIGNPIIYRTQNDGLSWDTLISPPSFASSYRVWAFEDRLFVLAGLKFWRLSLTGADWELVSPDFSFDESPHSIYVSDSLLFVGTEDNLWCSSNYGNTWTITPITLHNNYDDFCKIGDRVYKRVRYTILFTDDFGQHWDELPIPPDDIGIFNHATAGGQLLCSSYGKGVLRYDVLNQRLTTCNEGINTGEAYYLESGNGELWAATVNGAFAYDLAQEAWVDKGLLPNTASIYNDIAISPGGKIMACQGISKKIYLSIDSGTSWTTIVPINPNNGDSIWINKLYWLGENILLKSVGYRDLWSNDLGQTWQNDSFPNYIVFFQDRYYGFNWPHGLQSSIDSGLSWQPVASPNSDYIIGLYATDGRLFVLTIDNLVRTKLYSSANAINWSYSGDGLSKITQPPFGGTPYNGGIWHAEDRYYLHHNIGFFVSLDTCKTWLPIERPHGVLHLIDTTFYCGDYPIGVTKTGLPQNYGSLSSGYVYRDDNNNGIWEPNEAPLPNVPVTIKTSPQAWYPQWSSFTQSTGRYAISHTSGATDTLHVSIHSPYIENIHPSHLVVSNSGDNRNFGVHFLEDIADVSISGFLARRPRPGFPLDTYIIYRNEGTLPADGTISVKLDPNYHFVSADPPPTTMVGNDSLIWNITNLAIFNFNNIQISGVVDTQAVLGSIFKLSGHFEPELTDFTPDNNHFVRIDTVVGSYDPNEKRVEPARGLTPSEIADGKEIVYTVHFQNTGTFEADRVRITDMLDTALNISTIRFLGSSHDVTTFRVLPGNLLEVIYEQIALPDSNSNEPASHGFLSFAIQRNKSYYPSDIVKNTAAIYFDFNEPVITNTVFTPVVQPTVSSFEPSVKNSTNYGLLISPNPTTKDFQVDTQGKLTGPGEIVLIDTQGKICYTQQVSDLDDPIFMTTNDLVDGAYIVRATGKHGFLVGNLVVIRQ